MLKKDVLKINPNVDVVKLQRSGGVVSRNPKYRQKFRSLRTRVSSNLSGVKFDYSCFDANLACSLELVWRRRAIFCPVRF